MTEEVEGVRDDAWRFSDEALYLALPDRHGSASDRSSLRHIVEQAVAFSVPAGELRAPTRRKARVAFARQVAMYLAHVGCGLTLTEVGVLFGRDRTTVAHACSLVEDRRDDPGFDRSLDCLEAATGKLALATRQLRPVVSRA